MRILYTEDSPAIYGSALELLGILQGNGKLADFEVFHTADYAAAVDLLSNNGPFDAIISDYRIPGRNASLRTGGMDLLIYVRQQLGNLPFVFLSSTPPENILEVADRLGVRLNKEDIFDKSLTLITGVLEIVQERFSPKETATLFTAGITDEAKPS